MPARGGSALVVNHRVALSGTGARSAIASHRVGYIATRPGCDRAATEADLARAREREAVVGYVGCRPGSTALFDADGAVSLAEARRRLAGCGGAVVCSVIAVRREDCDRLGLGDKEGWQAFARANLTREYARMMGIPESRVGWVASFHLNSEANKHLHVLAYDRDGGFDRLLARADMERARRALTEAAIAPELERLGVERKAARERAVELVRSAGAAALGEGVALPEGGRISYGHLRRYHPEVARQVEGAVARAAGHSPELRRALADHERACREIADLRGLAGAEREAYLAREGADLRSRACNAALRAVAPDRTARPAPCAAPRQAACCGPATGRRRARNVERELSACTTAEQRASVSAAVRDGRPIPSRAVSGCPTLAAVGRGSSELLASLLAQASAEAAGGGRELSDEAGRAALRALSRLVASALSRAPSGLGSAARVAAAVARPVATIAGIPT